MLRSHMSVLFLCNVPQGHDGLPMDSDWQRCSGSTMNGQDLCDWLDARRMASISQDLQGQDNVVYVVFSNSFSKTLMDGLQGKKNKNIFLILYFFNIMNKITFRSVVYLYVFNRTDRWLRTVSINHCTIAKADNLMQNWVCHYFVVVHQGLEKCKHQKYCIHFCHSQIYNEKNKTFLQVTTSKILIVSVFAEIMWTAATKAWTSSAIFISSAKNFSLMNFRAAGVAVAGMASKNQRLRDKNGMGQEAHLVSVIKNMFKCSVTEIHLWTGIFLNRFQYNSRSS